MVDVGRGSEALYRDQLPGLLGQLAYRARVASITSSSAIEGIVVRDALRVDRILARKRTALRNRSERELAGYRDAQDYLFQGSWKPWLGYFVDILAEAYRTFANRAASDRADGSKQDRVRNYVLNHAPAQFRMGDVRAALPGISDPTIRVVLDRLRKNGLISPDGAGRTAFWRQIR